MHFRVFFSRSRYKIGIFFWVAKISNIFWGCLKFLIFFFGERLMLGPSLRMRKKLEYPPWECRPLPLAYRARTKPPVLCTHHGFEEGVLAVAHHYPTPVRIK